MLFQSAVFVVFMMLLPVLCVVLIALFGKKLDLSIWWGCLIEGTLRSGIIWGIVLWLYMMVTYYDLGGSWYFLFGGRANIFWVFMLVSYIFNGIFVLLGKEKNAVNFAYKFVALTFALLIVYAVLGGAIAEIESYSWPRG